MKTYMKSLLFVMIAMCCLFVSAYAEIYEDEAGYVYYDDFKTAPDAEKGQTEFESKLTLTRQSEGGLKIENTSIDDQYFQSEKKFKTGTMADKLIMEYSVRNPLGTTWRSYAFKLVIGGTEYWLFDQYSGGVRTPLFGEFYVVIDRTEGTACTYTKDGELKSTTDISGAKGALTGIRLRHQISKGNYIIVDYIRLFELSDEVIIENADCVEPDNIVFSFDSPIIPGDKDIAPYISVEGATIAEISKIGDRKYMAILDSPLEYNEEYSLLISDLEADYLPEPINKEIPFKVRDRKTSVEFLIDSGELAAGKRTVTADVLNERDVEDAYLVAAFYGADNSFVLSTKPVTTATDSYTVDIDVPSDIADGRLEAFITKSLTEIKPVGNKAVFSPEGEVITVSMTDAVIESTSITNDAENHLIKVECNFAQGSMGDVSLSCFNKADNVYFIQNKTIEDDKAEFIITVDDSKNEEISFEIHVTTNAKTYDYSKIYYPVTYVNDCFDKIKKESDAATMASYLETYKDALGIDIPTLNAPEDTKVSSAVIGLIAELKGTNEVDTIEELRNVIEVALFIALQKNGDTEAFISEFNEKYKLDEKCFEVYTSNFDKESRTKRIVEVLKSENFRNIKEVKDAFCKTVALCGFETSSHYSNTKNIITLISQSNFEGYKAFDFATYKKLYSTYNVDLGMTGKSFTTLESAAAEFNRLLTIQSSAPVTSGGGGGGSKGGKGGSSQAVQFAETPVSSANKTVAGNFSDVSDSHWASTAINTFFNKGIIAGKENGKFYPDDVLTREEAAKILVECLKIEASDMNVKFDDVNENSWSYKYIACMYEQGIMNGVNQNNFAPEEALTREMLAAMLVRLADKFGNETKEFSKCEFSDAENIAPYALSAVEFLRVSGIVKGMENNTFEPQSNCTRAQAVKMIYEFIKYFGMDN